MAGLRDEAKYEARGNMTREQVKDAVRERDGYACTKCGMTADEHVERHGRTLQVHRLTPGSLYTLEGCVTLCCGCHGPEPKRAGGQEDAEGRGYMVRLPEAYREPVTRLSRRNRRPITTEVQIALEKYFRDHGIEPPPCE